MHSENSQDEPQDQPLERPDEKRKVIEFINRTYALVLVGDKSAIMKFEADGTFRLIQVTAFTQWFGNRYIKIGSGKNEKVVSHGDFWMGHPLRRQYQGIEFNPETLGDKNQVHNLWHGFAVQPRPGDCSLFLNHIRDNVAQGDEDSYNYIIGWWASIVQRPKVKTETALIFRGKRGVGKTFVGEIFGSLFGPHYTLVAEPRYVVGRFNSHMSSLLVLQADEGFWAGDKTAEGKLKDLISGKDHFIEFKGKEPIRIKNYIRLFVTANEDWVFPAGFDERRSAVFDVGDARMGDRAYFAAIIKQMDNGGREALLHYLLNFDLSKVDVHVIPKNAALLEQKIESMTAMQAWWFDTLARGQLPQPELGINCCRKDRLFESYIRHSQMQGKRHRAIQVQVGMFLNKVAPGLTPHKINQQPIYEFPPLKVCRASFVKAIGQNITWDDPQQEVWDREQRIDQELEKARRIATSDEVPF